MKCLFNMPTEIKINLDYDLTLEEVNKVQRIFIALLKSGGLFGVKGGKTIIHFDDQARFRKIGLDYTPWVEREFDKYKL